MKFGDKLIELRKKNGYSQEELAEKLGVSRQSVSKWESNNTYPETDKIIQIANLFDCSMDDLINDKVTDVESTLRKNKSNVRNIWNSFLNFITETVDMFSKMKFIDGLKCIIVILLIGFLLNIAGIMICNTAAGIISSIFSFLSPERVSLIRDVLKGIFHLVWFVVSAIAIIHAFKIKYLNKYETVKKEKQEKETKENENKEVNFVKTKEDEPFIFLEVLAKIVIAFIKFIAAWIILGTIFTTIGLLVTVVIALTYISTNILFLWMFLLALAATVVSIQIIVLLIKFIFNKKVNVPLNLIIFISCVIISGVSVGLLALAIRNIEVIDDNSQFNLVEKTIELDYRENLVIKKNGDFASTYKYIIDNSLEENKIIISRQVDEKYFKLNTHASEIDKMPVMVVTETGVSNFKVYYELFISNLKNNKVVSFNNYGNDPLVIRANENTINKLIENQKKLFLIEEKREDNSINVTIKDHKVYFREGLIGEYNAIDDSIKYDREDYICKREIEVTEYGDRIVYTCNYTEE